MTCQFAGRLCWQLFAGESDLDEAAGVRHGLLVEGDAQSSVPRARGILRRHRDTPFSLNLASSSLQLKRISLESNFFREMF